MRHPLPFGLDVAGPATATFRTSRSNRRLLTGVLVLAALGACDDTDDPTVPGNPDPGPGPVPVAPALEVAWSPDAGPAGGRFESVVVDAGGRLFAATFDGWVFRSTDGGASFTPVLSADAGSPLWELVATEAGALFAVRGDALLRSVDAGATWERLRSNLPEGGPFRALAEGPDGTLLATAGAQGLFTSEDGGDAWFATPSTVSGLVDVEVAPDGTFFAVTQPDGVYRSEDEGASWELVFTPTQDFAQTVRALPDGRVLVGTQNRGIVRSTDGGDTWQTVVDDAVASFVLEFGAAPDGTLYAGTSTDALRSTDDGASWEPLGVDAFAVRDVVEDGGGTLWAGAPARGLMRSGDAGATWSQAALVSTMPRALHRRPNGSVHAGTTWMGPTRSTDGGATWQSVASRDIDQGLHPFFPARDYAEAAGGGLVVAVEFAGAFRSDDDGASWEQISPPGTGGRAVVVTEGGALLLGTEEESVLRSTDGGDTWTATGPAPIVGALATDAAGGVWAGTGSDEVAGSAAGLYRSDDGGVTWARVGEADLPLVPVTAVRTAGETDVHALVGGALFRSTDAGASWAEVPTDFTGATITALALAPDGDPVVGTDGAGVWRRGGGTWTRLDARLDDVPVLALEAVSADALLVGTAGSGVVEVGLE